MTVGGNVVTRLQEDLTKQEAFFTSVFDSAILYEGEHALLWLLDSPWWVIERGRRVPNLIYRDAGRICTNAEIYTEKTTGAARCRISRGDAVGLLFRAHPDSAVSGHPRVLLGPGVRSATTGRDTLTSIAASRLMSVGARGQGLERQISRGAFPVRR